MNNGCDAVRPSANCECKCFRFAQTTCAETMMVIIKRRFAKELLAEIASTVSSSMPPEEELSALLHDLERAR